MTLAHGERGHHQWELAPKQSEIDLNVFGVLMLNRVGGHVDHIDVVDQGSTAGR